MKEKIHNILKKGDKGERISRIFDFSIMWLIILNVIVLVLESMPSLKTGYESYFHYFEIFSIIIFTIEYVLRIYVSNITHPSGNHFYSALKFIFSTFGIIDLLAIMPFYLPFIIAVDLRILRILRLMRLFRIFKFGRYYSSFNLIIEVLKERKNELRITLFLTFLVLLISSFLMYYIEGDVQPEAFPSVPASLWWAIATLTTVGYGDVYPVTDTGKFISGLIALLGIGLVALPTGVIGAGFMDKIDEEKRKNSQDKNNKCPHCGKNID